MVAPAVEPVALPLAGEALGEYSRKLPSHGTKSLQAALQAAFKGRNSISFGTACSGSDIAVHTLPAFLVVYTETFDAPCALQHEFCCELHEGKRQFLAQQFEPRYIFQDVRELASCRALDAKSGMQAQVPDVDWLMGGFSRKSRTPWSSQAQKNLNCIARGDLSTETALTLCA